MDIWLLKCMMFVALATFEYAVLLGIRFGKHEHLSLMERDVRTVNQRYRAIRHDFSLCDNPKLDVVHLVMFVIL